MCPYAYYKKVKNYDRELIYCKKVNDVCAYSRYCNRLGKIIPSETMGDCVMNKKEVLIPKGASKVRKPVSNNKYLYVDVEENGNLYTYKLTNPFKEIPDYVYVEEGIDGYEIVKNKKRANKKM